jgi:hypothetical protein
VRARDQRVDRGQLDIARAQYRPATITVLFIGEAPPAGGTFFYYANSQVYRYVREVLSPAWGNPEHFLSAFAERGYYLDDLVLTPVDGIPMRDRIPIYDMNVP